MDYNSGVSLILPDSIGSIENDFDEEDIVHEQTNQNEVMFIFILFSIIRTSPLDCRTHYGCIRRS